MRCTFNQIFFFAKIFRIIDRKILPVDTNFHVNCTFVNSLITVNDLRINESIMTARVFIWFFSPYKYVVGVKSSMLNKNSASWVPFLCLPDRKTKQKRLQCVTMRRTSILSLSRDDMHMKISCCDKHSITVHWTLISGPCDYMDLLL